MSFGQYGLVQSVISQRANKMALAMTVAMAEKVAILLLPVTLSPKDIV
jgi:hypothetical protein